jgi:tetratricopeptide (TPR) repeat protein
MFEKNRNMFLLQVIVFLGIVFSGTAVAADYTTEHFIISSDLDPCFIEYAGKKAELCYDALLGAYFDRGWDQEPVLMVYYSDQQGESEALMEKAGLDAETAMNGYVPGTECLYVFRLHKDGNVVADNLLFGGIAGHFIEKNYKTELSCFKSELSCFLSKSLVVANGQVKLTRPMIVCCEELEGQINQESISANMKSLLSSSLEKYKSWDIAHPFTQAFFSWLYDRGLLKGYLLDVQTKGHRLRTLVESAGLNYGEIKSDLIVFIDDYSKFQKKLKLAEQTEDFFEKEQFLEEAYGFISDVNAANMELAKIYYENDDYEPCLKKLESAIDGVDNINNWQALKMTANVYYRQKEYDKAIRYYEKLWNISADYAYKYRIAYQIANCYYYQGSRYKAEKWYEDFLQSKWLTSDMQKCEGYAKEFLQDEDAAEYD